MWKKYWPNVLLTLWRQTSAYSQDWQRSQVYSSSEAPFGPKWRGCVYVFSMCIQWLTPWSPPVCSDWCVYNGMYGKRPVLPINIPVCASHVCFPCSCSKVNRMPADLRPADRSVHVSLTCMGQKKSWRLYLLPAALSLLQQQEGWRLGPQISPSQLNCKDYSDTVDRLYTFVVLATAPGAWFNYMSSSLVRLKLLVLWWAGMWCVLKNARFLHDMLHCIYFGVASTVVQGS